MIRFCRARTALQRGWAALVHHDGVPGFVHLPWLTRRRLDTRALGRFMASAECLHWLIALLVWWQCAAILVWTFDLRGADAALPFLAACLWAWPWLAAARRRHIAELLGHRWPE